MAPYPYLDKGYPTGGGRAKTWRMTADFPRQRDPSECEPWPPYPYLDKGVPIRGRSPDLLKKRNHLVDVRIAGQLELRIGGLCDGWTRRTGYG
jgi:hypothetical protein